MKTPQKRRRPTFPDTVRTGAKQRHSARKELRMPLSQLLARVKEQDAETAGWARAGLLNTAVLNGGQHEHLQALADMGAAFTPLRWSNPERIQQWTLRQTQEWLNILFDRGWDGCTGNKSVILAVAEYHPKLLSTWAKRAPKAWQTRRQWLEGMITMPLDLTAGRLRAWLEVGATPGTVSSMGMDRWIAQSKTGQGGDVLRAIDAFMKEDKQRRRVRGEPPFRDWPWEQMLELSIQRSQIHLVQVIVDLRGPLTAEQTMQLVCQAPDALTMLNAVRERGWKLPAPRSRQAGAFVSMAIMGQIKRGAASSPQPQPEALALQLLEEGYGGELDAHARAYVNSPKASEKLRTHLAHRALDSATAAGPVRTTRPRARL